MKFRTYSKNEERIYDKITDIRNLLDGITFVKVVCAEFPDEEWLAFSNVKQEKIFSDIQWSMGRLESAFSLDDEQYID